MKLKTLLRPSLTVVFAFIGAYIARGVTPAAIFEVTGDYFLLIAVLAFGILGFILPDLVEFLGRAGIAALARQIASLIPNPTEATGRALKQLPFRRKRRKNSSKYKNPIIVDTSALIDGRIADVAASGFLFGEFLVIPSVVGELHRLSDSSDDLKRIRGRRGLDVLGRIKSAKSAVKVIVLNQEPNDNQVDDKLISLAKEVRAGLLTVDFNLNKVAKVKNVRVINLNDLANAIKTSVLPGDDLTIKVNTIGKGREQGVGYLDDGTMVVIEDGARSVGKTLNLVVLRVIQTPAGKMIFAKAK